MASVSLGLKESSKVSFFNKTTKYHVSHRDLPEASAERQSRGRVSQEMEKNDVEGGRGPTQAKPFQTID